MAQLVSNAVDGMSLGVLFRGMAKSVWSVALPECDLAVELPQIYARSKSKGDPNDLIAVAGVVGALDALAPHHTTVYLPSEWKGQVPKSVMTTRTTSKLEKTELERIITPRRASLMHNVWDAIGIGIHHLKVHGQRQW